MGVYISDSHRNLIKCGFSSNISIQPLETRCNLNISYFIGDVNNGELLAPSFDPVPTFMPEDDIVKIGDRALYYLFSDKYYPLNVDLNNVEEIGVHGMDQAFYKTDLRNIQGFENIRIISDYGLQNAFNVNTSTNNTSGEANFTSLEAITTSGLSYAFYTTKITSATVGISKLDNTEVSSNVNNAFNYAFGYTSYLDKISFPNLEYIIHNYTYTSSVPTNAPFMNMGYQGADKIYEFPKLSFVVGGSMFQGLNYGSSNFTKSGKIEKTRFKKLELLMGNQMFKQAFYYNRFSKGLFMFPSLVRAHGVYEVATTANGCVFGENAFGQAQINGPVFFESIQGPYNGNSQLCFATASSASNTALAFGNAKNVTEFHFPATVMDCNVQTFFSRFENRWGCTGTSYSPTAAQKAIPIYADIVDSIVVNGIRYYRDETKSVYDLNNNKLFVAWVHKTITINGNEYLFQPKLLHNLIQSEKFWVIYGWRRDGTPEYDEIRGMFPNSVVAEYYTLERDPTVSDKAAISQPTTGNLIKRSDFTITIENVSSESIVYTAFDENTRVEPQSPMYEWTDGTYSFYSENNEYSQFKNNSKMEFHKKSSVGFYHFYVDAGSSTTSYNTVIKDDSTGTLTCQFYDGATRKTSGALSLVPPSGILTGTTVYSDAEGTVLGTVEHINNNWL